KKALLSKERGGLGVSSLYAMNIGLLFKWIWRFCTQGNTLWARIIKAIHGVDGRIRVNSRVGITSCWMSITKETNMLSMKGIDLMQYMRIKVGNGESTAFWEDKWCEEGALKDRRHPRGGCEQDQFQKLEDLVRLVILTPIDDRWILGLENTGEFSLASVRRGLGFKPRRESFPSGTKKEWDLSPKAKVRVLHTAQLDVTVSSNH
nr:RNA-directed DNA polymerase, eukaryota, reverse transcriptase zinc-binding domain protein [Tanacetum cinerariifolium]